MLAVAGVEVNEIIRAVRWQMVEQVFGKVAVRINQRDAMPAHDVLEDEVA